MAYFIKTERFTSQTKKLSSELLNLHLEEHCLWVIGLSNSGIKIVSGYLVNEQRQPGGGGLLIVEADSYQKAESIIKEDPMIVNKLVDWELSEWVPVFGQLMT